VSADSTNSTGTTGADGLLGASTSMAAGTIVSRITGMLRDIAIVAAIGLGVFADTYTVANTVPNIVYILIAGGALNAVFVPQLVRAMSEHADGGDDYANRLLTAVGVILLLVAAVATIAAPWIIELYSTKTWSAQDVEVATLFARFCLPQILFYGLFTMFSQVLNARGVFAPPMFAPIANNLVVIVTALIFIGVVSTTPTPGTITTGQIALLGIGTTLGIAVQSALVWGAMRRADFKWRLRFGLRGYGLGKAGYLAGWTFVFVLTNQLALIVITRLATAANVLASDNADVVSAGFTSYNKAYLLFVLPHSVITVSLVTALLPRMSRAAAASDLRAVADDVGVGCRLALAAMVPAAVVLLVLGQPTAELLFGLGNSAGDSARFVGVILAGFVIGLPAFTVFYVLLRGFYALEDTRTPALINLGMTAVNVAVALGLYAVAPDQWKVPALALGFSVSYLVTVPVMWRVLSGRLGGLPTFAVVRTLARTLLAALAVGVLMLAITVGLDAAFGQTRLVDLVTVVVAGGLGLALYLWLAQRMRIAEVSSVTQAVTSRLRRR
jgi:putative peptidoglycan lipid II flippase